jgi:dihydroorotase
MKILIKKAKIIDDESSFNGKIKDILIEDGMIKSIDDSINAKCDEIIDQENLHVSIGWFDLRARFCDPGLEHKENMSSGLSAAEIGGFTGVGLVSNTNPSISSKGQVEYLIGKSAMCPVEVCPIGTVTDGAFVMISH